MFRALKPGERVLDLCCGTGNLAHRIAARGYEVVGVDSSAEMLRFARESVPTGQFIQASAADFTLEMQVDAAVCAFDSLNHLIEAGELKLAFLNVHAALKPGGYFVFDVNTGEAYGERWNQSAFEVQPDHAFILQGGFDPRERIGTTKIAMFRLLPSHESECWQRSDAEMRQRPWEISEIEPMLESTGFSAISRHRAIDDLKMTGHRGIGRVYFRACKNLSAPNAS